jgi:hypothetical protein
MREIIERSPSVTSLAVGTAPVLSSLLVVDAVFTKVSISSRVTSG